MRLLKRSSAGRVRWLVVFAALLLVTTSVPLIQPSPADATEEGELPAPNFSAIEREEREHAEWLESPEAESQREASRTAYTTLSAGESQDLLLEAFPKQLKALNADPARIISGLEIEEPLGAYGALVGGEKGESALLESPVPVESEVGGEGKEPVDLALEEEGAGFVPENPLTEVQLPGSAEEPIQLSEGLEVDLPASDDHEAESLGKMNLFYPATAADTDTLLAPIAGGVEIFEQLRSPESPEQFRFSLNLPAGALLKEREDGGAEVLSASKQEIEEVPPPSAVDAQGTEVPVTMSVEGNSLVLDVSHNSREIAYPLLLDPELLDTPELTSSEWFTRASGNYAFERGSSEGGVPYLSVWARNGKEYAAHTDGQWAYKAPGETAFIEEAAFGGIHFEGCQGQLHGYLALYNPSSNTFAGRDLFSVQGGNGSAGGSWTATGGGYGYREAVIGVGTAEKSVKTTCVMETKVHGVTLKENDPEPPTINSVSGIPASGWFDPSKVGEATIVATDPGLGMKNVAIFAGKVTNNYSQQPCTGVFGHRCPSEINWKVPLSAPPEGEHTVKVTAEDALGKTALWTRQIKVDSQEPKIDLNGQLAKATEEEGFKGEENEAEENQLSLPVYNLGIKATDGNEKGEASEWQSGVKNIEVLLEGVKQEVPWSAQTCTQPQGSCPMEESYQLKLVGLSAGEHKLKIVATDQLGHVGEREIEFEYVPATGVSEDFVMQRFPLPDGEGDESEEEDPKRPELAVNVMNGNLVYHQRDVEVNGPSVDLNLERSYNSELPRAYDTEWGHSWTLAQTPKLEPEEPKKEGPPRRASMLRTSGLMTRAFSLPSETNVPQFDAKLGATVTRQAGGGFEVADQSGKTANSLVFNSSGKTTELKTLGYAKVDYGYEEGNLSEVAVHDPTLFSGTPTEEPQEPGELEAPAYVSQVGGEGSGPGRLSQPEGVALDPEGHLWVADTGHRRVQEFSSSGSFVNEFGISGSEGGEFLEPRAVTTDAQGNVWVIDKSLSKVQKFNTKGEYVSSFGSSGTGNGQFSALQGITTDSEGHLWTVEGGKSKSRVQEFSSTGTYIAQFGTVGTADGQMKEPQGIAIDAKGNVWIADTANNRVQEFSSKGTFIRKFGTLGSGNGQLSAPTALAFDPEGNVWVTDTANNRLEEFSAEGSYLAQVGTAGDENGQFSEPRGIAIDAKGDIWVADANNNRIQELTASEFVRKFGGEGSEAGNLSAPGGTATDKEGNVWVADTGHNRIQEFSPKGEFIRQFGALGSGNGLFSSPHGVAVDSEGNVWVADTGNYRVQEFDSKGTFIRKFGVKGTGNGNFTNVWGIAVDPSGHVWTTDFSETAARVQEFSSTGTYIRKFGTLGSAYNQFSAPKGIAADAKGNVWVSDTGNGRIAEYTGEGKFVRLVGSWGKGNGQLTRPTGVATDSEGNVWVADTENNRIEELSAEGTYLSQFGTHGNEDGQLDSPQGIAIDAKGNVWIADTANNRVQEVAASQFVRKFGGDGSGIGQLAGPNDVAVDSEGNLWVADTQHNRIQEFGPDGAPLREASTYTDQSYGMPVGIATDAKDDVWVAEMGGEVAEFSPQAKLIQSFNGLGDTEEIDYPSLVDVAVDPEGHIWTLRTPAALEEFNTEGQLLGQFEGPGSGEGQLNTPSAFAFDPEGNLWITDAGDDHVKEFTPKGAFVRAFGGNGVTDGLLREPEGISIDLRGDVWVADARNNRVQIFNSQGTYLQQFGAVGNNKGQLASPHGVATDSEGHVWVADTANNRVQKWQVSQYAFAHNAVFDSALGVKGTGAGMLKHPGGVSLDSEGNLWVADTENNRIEEFNGEGEFVETFGYGVNQTHAEGSEAEADLCTAASGDKCQAGYSGAPSGALNRPADVAIDSEGHVWVADWGKGRVAEFSQAGKYLGGFEGLEENLEPEAIAIDPRNGDIWVSHTSASQIQEYNESGKFIKTAGVFGELSEPGGIDVDPDGNLWVADWGNSRIVEFDEAGKFVRAFGSEGTANGQLRNPDDVVVDKRGEVWVADERNNRIEAFTEKGDFIAAFAAKGSEEGQLEFEFPVGLATDSQGNLWVSDSKHGRLERWGVYNESAANEGGVTEDAPEVQIEESKEGLVESVEGAEAGQTDYSHKGQMLTAVDGPKGKTAYEYDEAERLTKVTLPNGTWGQIEYDSIGRVKSVTVSIEGGKVKTTHFTYSAEPRRTVVEPEGEDTTTYDIGEDGSVLKWSYASGPPTIKPLGGSLYDQRVEVHSGTISAGDQTLEVKAESTRGIASIQVVANGDQIVAEKTCEQDYAKEGTECEEEALEFITESENWPPGFLQLEVIATDSTGASSSERFVDNVPYTAPPEPEAPEPPKFNEVKQFREEYGLDLDLKGNERAINERIFQLIADWHDPSTPEGEVARASEERWGVPMRSVDVAAMEARETDLANNVPQIEQWAEDNAPGQYSGYYVNGRAGGIITVGFTESPTTLLEQLKSSTSLSDPDRVVAYLVPHIVSLAALETGVEAVSEALQSNSELEEDVTGLAVSVEANAVEVDALNVSRVEELLAGVNVGVPVVFKQASGTGTFEGRYETTERMLAGQGIDTRYPEIGEAQECTAGPGAKERVFKKPTQEWVSKKFLLTAGHCVLIGHEVDRAAARKSLQGSVKIGTAKRTALPRNGGRETDGAAIQLNDPSLIPLEIFRPYRMPLSVHGATKMYTGQTLCISGVHMRHILCRETRQLSEFRPHRKQAEKALGLGPIGEVWEQELKGSCPSESGDSGAPVWDARTRAIVGVFSGNSEGHCVVAPMQPLRNNKNKELSPGILSAPGMGKNLKLEIPEGDYFEE